MTTQAQLDVLLNSDAFQVICEKMQIITGAPEGTIQAVVEAYPLNITLSLTGPHCRVVLYCQPRMGTLQ
jgi:hypothetical protein